MLSVRALVKTHSEVGSIYELISRQIIAKRKIGLCYSALAIFIKG
jgi:hypothetical protein